ncbi:hypothetical protein, partial [Escherichia coli]|uniref:hypothetical protein n=1 Tax=Escherichia coli TaxID=562 RepID=UPI002283FF47
RGALILESGRITRSCPQERYSEERFFCHDPPLTCVNHPPWLIIFQPQNGHTPNAAAIFIATA